MYNMGCIGIHGAGLIHDLLYLSRIRARSGYGNEAGFLDHEFNLAFLFQYLHDSILSAYQL